MPPSSAYLLLLAHPAIQTGNTAKDPDGEREENTDVEIRDDDAGGDGHDREGAERTEDRERGRQIVQGLVHIAWDDVFLLRRLEDIGEGLEEAPRSDNAWAWPVLHPTGEFALKPDAVAGDGEGHVAQDEPHDEPMDQGFSKVIDPPRP